MKIIVIGGVAAGTKAAAKLKREMPGAEVVIYTKGHDISYAGCGLPYYVGGSIESRDDLIVNTPQKYAGLTGVQVFTGREAVALDAAAHTVTLRDTETGAESGETYDKLILAVGAEPFVPNVPGTALPGVFPMRTPDDAIHTRAWIEQNNCRRAVVVGGGFIGLEVAENLMAKGLTVTVVDMAPQLMPNIFDPEMADYARRRLTAAGMRILTGTALKGINGTDRATGIATDTGDIPADLVVLAIGIRPATGFLQNSGLDLFKGTIRVDEKQKTNLPDIYAVGDCAMVHNQLTGAPQWSAMGSTANLTGRCLARSLAGHEDAVYGGCLGTGVVRLAEDLNGGRTGLTEAQARDAGFDPVSVVCVTDDKAHYYPGADSFVTKLIADRSTHRLLGIQVFGAGAVDKMVDIAVTGIATGARLETFDTLDFAYAPPFSTAIHPFVQACYILENKLAGAFETFTPAQYAAGEAAGYEVLDVQPEPKLPGARWINLSQVHGPIEGLAPDAKLLLVCAKGKRGYFLQNRLKSFGYTNTRVLEGGAFFNKVKVPVKSVLTPEEIKRVKGLGCLQDKRYPDVFNVRVITRNGKITAQEQRAITEAAERYGSGEVTMTTRLTLEIQGVPYAKLDDLMEDLNRAGLQTGGTGSLVRPVVSCKGTTCQYGLLDSFGLSEKIHERFYLGYHNVTLPHKFKIAVGGCPNNCVKPDLNDLGIVGQRVPMPDLSKCRGCTKCQVEQNCPIHVAKLEGGVLHIDPDACNHCGRCRSKCPFGVTEEFQDGYRIYIGGRWGKRIAHGHPLDKIFTSEEEVLDVVERAILFFRSEGITGERFADTIDRLGFDYVQDKLLTAPMDKSAALKKKVVGGATC
ncbi:MAG: FAD-dependent oxidoreductase [Gemmiger sp.]|uniref:FAD-dependent oxidoreductase n=1 Tax=Gemmiger sp. TaxID=2049027 RepID=UPI002E79B531|nr:FAD-dependent oxidoreductase [Gemmiger sp.]MEE0799875.1 FAD-dependent oxidoreductase [Gemmiger sp.]